MTPLVVGEGVAVPTLRQPADLVARAGQRIALIGPNGSGKTSLLRALAAFDGAIGMVRIGGETLATASPKRRARLVGFLPAGREAPWPIRVADFLSLGAEHAPCADRAAAIASFELDPLLDRPIDRLSTGERTRVMLARLIVQDPLLVLLDEPFAHLDPRWALLALDHLDAVTKRERTVVAAVHDLSLADRFDRVLLLSGGRIEADGSARKVLQSSEFEKVFGIRWKDGVAQLRRPEGRQSSR